LVAVVSKERLVHAIPQNVDWNAVYAIGALGLAICGMLAGIAWRMSHRFTRLDDGVRQVSRGQRRAWRKIREHGERLQALELRQPEPRPPVVQGPWTSGYVQGDFNPLGCDRAPPSGA
jgi:hypothetical protein